ncbi:hypothetical protein BD408DRAFT_448770 [Parasitella parasitica]|nr:hypothetical protein BD408DRAFT_448770 [Parasitella parasitica]
MSGKKRTKTNEPKKSGSDKRSRTDGVFSVGETSSSSPSAADVREVVKLPASFVVAEGAVSVVKYLEKIQSDNKEESNQANPVIIGSRAAAFWFPSFRPCADWDIVATAQQAIELIKSEQSNCNLEIKLVMQPLNANVVKRRPLPNDIKKKLKTIPEHLYKISGKNKESSMKFEIEIAANEQVSPEVSSAGQILSMCNSGKDSGIYMNFSIGPSKGLQCIVSPIELLEALKTSHIFWPAYFEKHIADLHGLRVLLASSSNGSTSVNFGIRAEKSKPLTPPARSAELEDFLKTRTLEVEAFRGTPGAHISLDVSNEDFLGRDDDLFVTRHIPHDDVHAIVMYGNEPIYDQLKTDKSKAMVSRELFEKAPYEKQIQCVKEEAMVISLERFLLPKLTLDPAFAYRSALLRICTTLTKGWFRQFAVDNFPRLAVCDKDLIPIRDAILTKHPLPPKVRNDPLEILKKTITNLEDLHTMERLLSLTKTLKNGKKIIVIGGSSDNDSDDSDSDDSDDHNYGYRNENSSETEKNFWTISSNRPGQPDLLISFVNSYYANQSDCIPSYYFHATLSVQLLTPDVEVKKINAFKCKRDGLYTLKRQKFHKAATSVAASNEGGSWGGGDIWSEYDFVANPLEDEVEILGLEGLTGDLLMTYILAVVQPKLFSNGETPIRNHINSYKSKGLIPVSPDNHLWFNCWKFNKLMK